MTRRYKDALAIWDGACNPSAIVNSLVNACAEVRAQNLGTASVCQDSAVRLMVYQLAFLTGVISGAEECKKFEIADAVGECRNALGAP